VTTEPQQKPPTAWVGPKPQPQLPLRYELKHCLICGEPEGSLYAKNCCENPENQAVT